MVGAEIPKVPVGEGGLSACPTSGPTGLIPRGSGAGSLSPSYISPCHLLRPYESFIIIRRLLFYKVDICLFIMMRDTT
jgi:hypothetical protein